MFGKGKNVEFIGKWGYKGLKSADSNIEMMIYLYFASNHFEELDERHRTAILRI